MEELLLDTDMLSEAFKLKDVIVNANAQRYLAVLQASPSRLSANLKCFAG